MDYLKHYVTLVDSRKSRALSKESGYEIHHIIPRCLDGENEEFNLVKLSYREHLIAHKLLAKIFSDNEKLQYAVNAMLIQCPDREKHREHMKQHNPMFSKDTREKMSCTRKAKFASGEWTPREITAKERKMHSDRMKKSNPMTNEPWKNHTAKPVRVYYTDGTTKDFIYMKEITILTGVPYATLKYMSKNTCGSPKWSIERLEKI
jgi:HNH endonuclease.